MLVREMKLSLSELSVHRVWDVDSTGIKATMEGHAGAVNAVAVNYNGTMCASGSNDKTCRQVCQGKEKDYVGSEITPYID